MQAFVNSSYLTFARPLQGRPWSDLGHLKLTVLKYHSILDLLAGTRKAVAFGSSIADFIAADIVWLYPHALIELSYPP